MINEKVATQKVSDEVVALMNGEGDEDSSDSQQSQNLLSQLGKGDVSLDGFPEGKTQELPLPTNLSNLDQQKIPPIDSNLVP